MVMVEMVELVATPLLKVVDDRGGDGDAGAEKE